MMSSNPRDTRETAPKPKVDSNGFPVVTPLPKGREDKDENETKPKVDGARRLG